MPISKAALAAVPALALLAACGGEAVEDPARGQLIACALGGAKLFEAVCRMERIEGEQGDQLVIRHPDGGFRRFDLGVPGQGLATADGMEQAVVTRGEGMVEVAVGADRYELPLAE